MRAEREGAAPRSQQVISRRMEDEGGLRLEALLFCFLLFVEIEFSSSRLVSFVVVVGD